MKIKLIYLLQFLFFTSIYIHSSDHGIYLLTNKNLKSDIESTEAQIVSSLSQNGFRLLKSTPIHTPDYVRESEEDHCGSQTHLIVFTSDDYISMLTSYGSKYLVAGFLKVGIYETPNGINVSITDPETINRIIFNDMYDNDEEAKYNEVITKTKEYKNLIIKILHNSVEGDKIEESLEPIRDDEDLAESSRDMFMMVGPLTLFTDEDQFPIIYSEKNEDGFSGIQKLKSEFVENLKSFTPDEDDIEYRWYPNEGDLKWKIISQIKSPNNDAVLLGLTRPRTEAVSFNIAGSSREEEGNMCPGIDHVSAYPIEVLLIQEGEDLNVYTQREMHRMDMYFWDAGMSAFMDHMSMPGVLDESIKKALLGSKFIEE